MGAHPERNGYLDVVPPYRAALLGPVARWQAWWRDTAALPERDEAFRLAVTQGFVATTAQLHELGWRDHDIRRELRRGRWSRPTRGVLSPVTVGAEGPDQRRVHHALASTGAALLRPQHSVSSRSAAILHGLPTVRVPAAPVLTTESTDSQGRRSTVLVRSASLDADASVSWYGAPVTAVARTLVDLARERRRDAIMAADAALREKLVTWDEIVVELIGACGWPGITQARDVLSLASPLAESPLESVVRLALHDDGFPAPTLQMEVGPYRLDFCWPERRVILEADGRGKYTGDELWREKQREQYLRTLGYTVERVLWSDVIHRWPETSRRLWALIVG